MLTFDLNIKSLPAQSVFTLYTKLGAITGSGFTVTCVVVGGGETQPLAVVTINSYVSVDVRLLIIGF